MEHRNYTMHEIVGTSGEGVDDAVRSAITQLHEQGVDVAWYEVDSMRGFVEGGAVREFQVVIRAGARPASA